MSAPHVLDAERLDRSAAIAAEAAVRVKSALDNHVAAAPRSDRLQIQLDLVEPDAILALARGEFEKTVALGDVCHLGFDQFCSLVLGELPKDFHDVFETVVVPADCASPVVLRIALREQFKLAVADAAQCIRHDLTLSLLPGTTAKPDGGAASSCASKGVSA